MTEHSVYPRATQGRPRAITYGDLEDTLALTLHTTETVNWAGFDLGATAPHYSYKPATREWRWHGASLDKRVGTMRSSKRTGIKANEKSWQVEIVAYSDLFNAARRGGLWVGNFTADHYADLAHFARWLADNVDGLLNLDAVMAVPATGWRYGNTAGLRLPEADWLAFDGIGAHGGVPGQTHWDTGVLDLARIATQARALAPTLDADMQLWLAALQAQPMEFYEALRAQTGHPGGNASYWGSDYVPPPGEAGPSPAEWDDALLELVTATVEAGVLTTAGIHNHDIAATRTI